MFWYGFIVVRWLRIGTSLLLHTITTCGWCVNHDWLDYSDTNLRHLGSLVCATKAKNSWWALGCHWPQGGQQHSACRRSRSWRAHVVESVTLSFSGLDSLLFGHTGVKVFETVCMIPPSSSNQIELLCQKLPIVVNHGIPPLLIQISSPKLGRWVVWRFETNAALIRSGFRNDMVDMVCMSGRWWSLALALLPGFPGFLGPCHYHPPSPFLRSSSYFPRLPGTIHQSKTLIVNLIITSCSGLCEMRPPSTWPSHHGRDLQLHISSCILHHNPASDSLIATLTTHLKSSPPRQHVRI